MAKLAMFRVYPSQLIHLGKPDPEKPGFDWFYVSLCGRKLIGHEVEDHQDWEQVCKPCQRAFDHAKKVYEELETRFL